ncbi:hypothetical protein ACFL6C_11175 [Myxococcota bacterium]
MPETIRADGGPITSYEPASCSKNKRAGERERDQHRLIESHAIRSKISHALVTSSPRGLYVRVTRASDRRFQHRCSSNRELTLEDLCRENTVYLLDEVDTLDQAIEQITPLVEEVFSEQLAGWWTVEDDWPRALTIGQLLEWFDVQLGTMVADVGTEALRVEEL